MWSMFVRFREDVESLTVADLISKYEAIGVKLTLRSKDFPLIEANQRHKEERFDNKENFYLKIVDLLKRYAGCSGSTNLLQFIFQHIVDLRNTSADALRQLRVEKLNDFIARLEVWRRSSDELQLLLALLCFNQKRLIKLYLKLRGEILKYNGDRLREEHYLAKMHNIRSYDRKEVELDSVMVKIELWRIIAGRVLEGTAYHSPQNLDRVLHYLREAEVKEHRVDAIMKIQATTLIKLCMCVLSNLDHLFSSKKVELSPQPNPESPKKLGKTGAFTQSRNQFLTGLLESKTLKFDGTPSHKRTEIEDIMQTQAPEHFFRRPVDTMSPRTDRPKIDYSYRLATCKPSKPQRQLKKQHTFTAHSSNDPIIDDIRKSMKRLSWELNQTFDIIW